MRIGGITFALRSRRPLRLAEPPPVYGDFLFYDEKMGADITVEVAEGEGPDLDGADKLFDTGDAWSLYRCGEDYCLALRPPALGGETVWTARFNPEGDGIALFCGERLRGSGGNGAVTGSPFCYPLDQMLLMYLLAPRGGLCLHAAGAVVASRGCVFPGKSGAGKSTVSRLLAGGEGTALLSDDRVIVRRRGDGFDLYGTPWAGEARVAVNGSHALEGLFFLRQSSRDAVLPLRRRDTLEKLLPVVSVPWYDDRYRDNVLGICEELIEKVPARMLEFRRDGAAARTVAAALREPR